jgi:ADP-ribose pyrophosphatase YjhB (NUDIX family)
MATDRHFAAFAEDGREGLGLSQAPKDGLCISSFVVISEKSRSENVLAGRINPKAPWDHIGAVNPGRLGGFSKGWMLPSSHLIMLESPREAANRILREQLEIEESKANLSPEPVVFSDVREGKEHHWDIGFIYTGEMTKEDVPKNPSPWLELKFVDFRNTPGSDFVRFHQDVIDYAMRK